MKPNDEPFPEDAQEYRHLSRLYASQTEQEAQAIERVRGRLASMAASPAPSHSTGRELTTRELPTLSSAQPRRQPSALPSARIPAHVMRSRRGAIVRSVAAALVVAVLVGGFAILRLGGSSSPATNSYHWTTIPSANTAQAVNALKGLTMRSATDGWAWGTSNDTPTNQNSNPISAPLVEHWDGQKWSIVATPAMPYGGEVTDIVSLAPDNAWAVGGQLITPSGSQNTTGGAVIEHWDGRHWTIVPSNIATIVNTDDTGLAQLAALSPQDIWAVGSYSGATNSGLIVHWDGRQWQEVAHPTPPGGMDLSGVTALAPNDIWVVGRSDNHSSVFEHWDGVQWRSVPAAQTSRPAVLGASTVTSIAAVSANDVWAVGHEPPAVPFLSYSQPLIEHWDGQSWSVVASPSVSNAMLVSVVALGQNNVWAVGVQGLGGDVAQQGQGLIEHWDGQQWSVVVNPSPQPFTTLNGVAGDPFAPGKVWVVGATGPDTSSSDQPTNTRTLIETGQ